MSLQSVLTAAHNDWLEFLAILGKAAGYAPEAATTAEVVATVTGNSEVVPLIAAAAAGVAGINDAAHADNVAAIVAGFQSTLSAAKTIAAGAVARPQDGGGSGPPPVHT